MSGRTSASSVESLSSNPATRPASLREALRAGVMEYWSNGVLRLLRIAPRLRDPLNLLTGVLLYHPYRVPRREHRRDPQRKDGYAPFLQDR